MSLTDYEQWREVRLYCERCEVDYEALLYILGNASYSQKKIKSISNRFTKLYLNERSNRQTKGSPKS